VPSNAETIATIKTEALERIAEITSEPKPSYNVDGQSVSWTQYLEQLQQTVAWCDQQANATEIYEETSQAYT